MWVDIFFGAFSECSLFSSFGKFQNEGKYERSLKRSVNVHFSLRSETFRTKRKVNMCEKLFNSQYFTEYILKIRLHLSLFCEGTERCPKLKPSFCQEKLFGELESEIVSFREIEGLKNKKIVRTPLNESWAIQLCMIAPQGIRRENPFCSCICFSFWKITKMWNRWPLFMKTPPPNNC